MTYSVTPSASGTSIKQDGVEVANINISGEWSFKDAGVIKTLTNIARQNSLGSGQSWQSAEFTNTGATFTDGTAKFRAPNVTYTNTTGRSIAVTFARSTHLNTTLTYTLDGISVLYSNSGGTTGISDSVTFIVPNDSTYSSNAALTTWLELR